ncbi:MAG: AAA family ATPase [Gemmataceae bacterium]
MFKHLIIKNFRCFAGLHLAHLDRVNLIAGKNNTGKTSLLEALCLHCGPDDSLLPTKIHEFRGIGDNVNAYSELWNWLFIDKTQSIGIELTSQDDKGIYQTLEIQLTTVEKARAKNPNLHGVYASNPRAPCLMLVYKGPEAFERRVWVVGGQGEAWFDPVAAWKVPCVFISSGIPSSQMAVKFFSELDIAKRADELLPALNVLEPRLKRLSTPQIGGQSEIHGDIGLNHLVPIPLMGEGIKRLLSILVSIFHVPGGVVLIDEVENGLHYSVMKDVWKAIALAARQMDVQVFATTHSYECIQAAHEAFLASDNYDLRLFRLDRINDEIQVTNYDAETIGAAVDYYHEVR